MGKESDMFEKQVKFLAAVEKNNLSIEDLTVMVAGEKGFICYVCEQGATRRSRDGIPLCLEHFEAAEDIKF